MAWQLQNALQYERPLRLGSGLILFSFATSHLINHAFGLRSVEAMQAASAFLLAPWQTPVGLSLLYSSFFIHASLGLFALYRRRHLRIPLGEAWQLGLGLAIPLVFIPHAAAIRIGETLFGNEYGFGFILYRYFVANLEFGLPRQLLLLTAVWLHGCIGLRSWLRSKPWYPKYSPALASFATAVPLLAVLGVLDAGLDVREAIQLDPDRTASIIGNSLRVPVDEIIFWLLVAYIAVVLLVILLRVVRDWRAQRFGQVKITYLGQGTLSVPLGFTILEASRFHAIPHVSICGGRARCSTCRVRVLEGGRALPEPAPLELRTLQGVGSPPNVRLACQTRPQTAVTIEQIVRPRVASPTASRFDAAVEVGQEEEVVAMFVDLRGSTRIATRRLPYDALFLFDRYIQVISHAISERGGYITSIAGDGIMSVFVTKSSIEDAARDGLRAALAAWQGLESLSAELVDDIGTTLEIGIGVHAGVAIVGRISTPSQHLQFLGDTGNTAAKLQDHSKQLGCTMVASIDSLKRATLLLAESKTVLIEISGRPSVEAVCFRDWRELEALIASASPLSSPSSPET